MPSPNPVAVSRIVVVMRRGIDRRLATPSPRGHPA